MMTNKNSPIAPQLLADWKKLYSETSKLENQICNRIDYIVKTVFKTFGAKLSTWYFYGAEEGEMGDLNRALYTDYFSVITELVRDRNGNYNHIDMVILLKDGSEWGFEGEYPTRWLFEDFEEELIEGKKKYQEKVQEEKNKKKEKDLLKKQKNELLVEKAKAKLTKEELKALKSS